MAIQHRRHFLSLHLYCHLQACQSHRRQHRQRLHPVVDDDLDTIDFLQLFLSMQGLYVVAFDHADGVLEAIWEVKPDVVLLDLQTPEDRQAGLVVLDRLCADAQAAAIPVVLMSCDDDALRRHAGRIQELGATPLPKPFEPARLWQMIKQFVA